MIWRLSGDGSGQNKKTGNQISDATPIETQPSTCPAGISSSLSTAIFEPQLETLLLQLSSLRNSTSTTNELSIHFKKQDIRLRTQVPPLCSNFGIGLIAPGRRGTREISVPLGNSGANLDKKTPGSNAFTRTGIFLRANSVARSPEQSLGLIGVHARIVTELALQERVSRKCIDGKNGR
ncbi:short-chain dehydrogenase [Moniliophthora roreri]|nr:short-chain dehydrogenase [Moniliophthora roreri]